MFKKYFMTNLIPLSIILLLSFMFFFYFFLPSTEIFFFLNGINMNLDLKKNVVFFIAYIMVILFLLLKNILKSSKSPILLTQYIIIILGVYTLVTTESLLLFLLGYEAVLVPSGFLVYFISPNRRSFLVTMYFILWTQLGSFMVLLSIAFLHFKYSIFYFYQIKNFLIFFDMNTFITFLLMTGFLIKIPTWPFHFWLTKTHVEANTGFSILLSGVLVKTALVGVLKTGLLLSPVKKIILFLLLIGSVEIGFKIFYQTDFKKLAAYLTIQEMSLILLSTLFCRSSESLVFFFKFIFLHTVLSASLFTLSEFIYVKNGSRLLNKNVGLLIKKPIMSLVFYTNILCFIGLPFTLKFFIEVLLVSKIITTSLHLYILFLIVVQTLTIVFFFRNIICFIFFDSKNINLDLSKSEFMLIFFILLPLFLLPLV